MIVNFLFKFKHTGNSNLMQHHKYGKIAKKLKKKFKLLEHR